MDDRDRVYSVLVVSAAAKFHTSLRGMLPEDRYEPLCATGSVAEARRMLLERPFDIVIISAPLPDEFGTKLALHIIERSSAGVLLLVKAEHYPDLAARLSPQGILLLQKPTTPALLLQSMQLLCGTRERLRRMEEKTATIEEKMADIRLVNRAKWRLIQEQGLTEQEAHRYIEKQAMDRCVTRRTVAEEILAP
jgi:AmiR/NasT family two-component response regulator